MKGLMQSDLFDVAEIEQINADIVQKQHDQANLDARKLLRLPYYENPKNDAEKLMNYQHDYIMNNSQDAWGKLIQLSFVVTKRLVWRWMKTHKMRMDEIEQDEKTSIAVEYVLRRYKTRIGYCVTKNFITALQSGVEHAMLYKTKLDEETDFIEDIQGLKL